MANPAESKDYPQMRFNSKELLESKGLGIEDMKTFKKTFISEAGVQKEIKAELVDMGEKVASSHDALVNEMHEMITSMAQEIFSLRVMVTEILSQTAVSGSETEAKLGILESKVRVFRAEDKRVREDLEIPLDRKVSEMSKVEKAAYLNAEVTVGKSVRKLSELMLTRSEERMLETVNEKTQRVNKVVTEHYGESMTPGYVTRQKKTSIIDDLIEESRSDFE